MGKDLRLAQVLQRQLSGRVLSKVAEELNMSVSLLHDWYSSARRPSAKNFGHLRKLAEYLGLTLEELLFDEVKGRQIISTTIFSDRGICYRIIVEKLKP